MRTRGPTSLMDTPCLKPNTNQSLTDRSHHDWTNPIPKMLAIHQDQCRMPCSLAIRRSHRPDKSRFESPNLSDNELPVMNANGRLTNEHFGAICCRWVQIQQYFVTRRNVTLIQALVLVDAINLKLCQNEN